MAIGKFLKRGNMHSNIEKLINKKYWNKFYENFKEEKPSSFARFCLPYIKGEMVELGCGNCRDLLFFSNKKIKCIGIDNILNIGAEDYIKNNKSPKYVYTRFFWHAIDRRLQLKILKWVKGWLFIEARTDEDKPKDLFGKHKRNLVNVSQLIEDLLKEGFIIRKFKQGKGLSPYKGENPHLVRIICQKNV
jgi:hypothetical protein